MLSIVAATKQNNQINLQQLRIRYQIYLQRFQKILIKYCEEMSKTQPLRTLLHLYLSILSPCIKSVNSKSIMIEISNKTEVHKECDIWEEMECLFVDCFFFLQRSQVFTSAKSDYHWRSTSISLPSTRIKA